MAPLTWSPETLPRPTPVGVLLTHPGPISPGRMNVGISPIFLNKTDSFQLSCTHDRFQVSKCLLSTSVRSTSPGPSFPVQSPSAAVVESRGEHHMCSIPPQLTPQPPSPLQAPHLFRTQAVSIMGWAQRHSPCLPSCFQRRHSLCVFHTQLFALINNKIERRTISIVQQFHSGRTYSLFKLKAWSELEMEAHMMDEIHRFLWFPWSISPLPPTFPRGRVVLGTV